MLRYFQSQDRRNLQCIMLRKQQRAQRENQQRRRRTLCKILSKSRNNQSLSLLCIRALSKVSNQTQLRNSVHRKLTPWHKIIHRTIYPWIMHRRRVIFLHQQPCLRSKRYSLFQRPVRVEVWNAQTQLRRCNSSNKRSLYRFRIPFPILKIKVCVKQNRKNKI